MPSFQSVEITRWNGGFSRGIARAVANDFLNGSDEDEFSLAARGYESATYKIRGDITDTRIENEDGDTFLTTGMSTADFVAGVAYALALGGVIPKETVTMTNISRVCFALGELSASCAGIEGTDG